MKKENWTDKVLDSTKGKRQVAPPTWMLRRIEERLNAKGENAPRPNSGIGLRLAIACSLLLLLLNGFALYINFSKQVPSSEQLIYDNKLINNYNIYNHE
jgi:hypothetical protein